MYYYVARQPIFDIETNVVAYELLYRDGENNAFPDICSNEATSKLLTQSHLISGLESIVQNKIAFVNFSEETLLHRFPTSISPESMYIEVLETVEVTDELIYACKELHKAGYKLAFDDYDFDERWAPLEPYISIIKVDVQEFNVLQISKLIRKVTNPNIVLLGEKVETIQEFERLKQLGFTLFQGYFFAKPEIIKQKNITPNKQTLFELIGESTKAELDITAISELMQTDVALSYKLLRFINSAAFSTQQEIGSLKQALIYMGEVELKKFISLIALANLSKGKTGELITLSILRAKFCSSISEELQDSQNPPVAFLTGLFSLIDAMLDMPIDDLLEKLPVQAEIKDALTDHSGYLGKYLSLVTSYEKAEWDKVTKLNKKLKLSDEFVQKSYYDALLWTSNFITLE